jgi:hypothetical protein
MVMVESAAMSNVRRIHRYRVRQRKAKRAEEAERKEQERKEREQKVSTDFLFVYSF